MITLDEAIEHERKQAERYRCEYECECDYYGKGFVDDHADEFECINKMYDHEQLAYWLEELKAYKQQHIALCEKYCVNTIEELYVKAIDDIMNKAKEIQEEQIKTLNNIQEEVENNGLFI